MGGRARRSTIALLLLWAVAATWFALRPVLMPQRMAERDTRHTGASSGFDQDQAQISDELRQWRRLVTGSPEATLADATRQIDRLRGVATVLPDIEPDTPLIELSASAFDRIEQLEQELEELRRQLQAAQLAATGRESAATVVDDYVRELHRERMEEQQRMLSVVKQRERQIQSLADRVQTLAKRLQDERRDKAKLEAEMLRELDRLRTALEELRRYRPKPVGAVRLEPDGRIVRANNVRRIVWINLGSRHGVQPGMTFNVWSAVASVDLDKPKANIVVSRVIDRGLSEARIVDADPKHPVVDGDLICNAAFDPGRRTTFVLAGVIDIDGDGTDDRQIVRNCIRRSGGEVLAELLPDGTVQGEVRAEVRYFVRGEARGSLRQLREQLEAEARDFGAYVLTVDKLIDLLGLPRVRRGR